MKWEMTMGYTRMSNFTKLFHLRRMCYEERRRVRTGNERNDGHGRY